MRDFDLRPRQEPEEVPSHVQVNAEPGTHRLTLATFAAIWGIGFLPQVVSPHVVGTLVRHLGLDEGLAGLIQSVELGSVAVTALLLAPWMARLPRRRLAVAGALLALTSHAVSAAATGAAALVAARVAAGIGAGLVLAAGNATAAASAEPERLYGRMFVLMGIAYAFVFVVMGYFAAQFGAPGVFGFETAWVAMLLPALWLLPAGRPMAIEEGRTIAPLPRLTALLMVGALGTFASADVSVWSFSARVAASIGLAESDIGWALGASSALALVGGTVVVWLGTRLGRLRSIAVGLCFVSACALGSTRAPTAAVFLTGLVVYQAGYTFLMSYLYGTASALDRHGRLMVATAGATLAGGALGPYIGGTLAAHHGYSSIGVYYLGVAAVVFTLMIVVVRRSRIAPSSTQ